MTDAHHTDAGVARDNGLRADDYVRVARPTSAVADTVLDALRRTGIAARVTAPGDDGRCELWADARELDDVTTVIDAVVRHTDHDEHDLAPVGEEAVLLELGLGGATSVDELDTFAPLRDTGPDGPDGHDQDDEVHGTRNPTPSARPYPTPARPRPSRARRNDEHDDDPDDHFLPDEPESLRTLSRTTMWALAILAVGVVALALSGLAPGLVGGYAPLASLLGTAAVLVGVGMLVTRLRDGRPDDGDDRGGPNGDGAVL